MEQKKSLAEYHIETQALQVQLSSYEYYARDQKAMKNPSSDNKNFGLIPELESSKTIYVQNLPKDTLEERIRNIFAPFGPIKNIILGRNRLYQTGLDFAFVEFYRRDSALKSAMSSYKIRVGQSCLKTDIDKGYKPSREFGKAKDGGRKQIERRREKKAEWDKNKKY